MGVGAQIDTVCEIIDKYTVNTILNDLYLK